MTKEILQNRNNLLYKDFTILTECLAKILELRKGVVFVKKGRGYE